MGCDIHLHFEKKNSAGVWEKLHVPEALIPDDRDYRVFTFLAGVRPTDGIKPQFALRGIPKDSSVLRSYFGDDYHSFTYATFLEIMDAPWERWGLNETYFYIFCCYVFPRVCASGVFSNEEERNIRIVMGFDS